VKYVHFIGGKFYAIDGPACERIETRRGESAWETLLRQCRGSTGLFTFGQFADEWLNGITYAIQPFGYQLAPSAVKQIGEELHRMERVEYAGGVNV
jgi:hypothetical protein